MTQKFRRFSVQWVFPITIGAYLLALLTLVQPVGAINQIPDPVPQPGSYGLGATKTQPPPTQAATITTPGNGASFTTSPITVSGVCETGLLVQVYNNAVMVGSVMCTSGSFSLQVSLFAGTNELTATMLDDLEQAGPISNIVSVTYTDTNFTAFGELITLTSSYGRRAAPAGGELSWPLQLTGGTGPYAFSLDWGDGSATELKSQSLSGVVTIAHNYEKAGIYNLNVKVSDVNGVSAFLQVVAVASGKVDTSTAAASTGDSSEAPRTTMLSWIPAAVGFILLIPAYWLGGLSKLVSIHNKMLKERDSYNEG